MQDSIDLLYGVVDFLIYNKSELSSNFNKNTDYNHIVEHFEVAKLAISKLSENTSYSDKSVVDSLSDYGREISLEEFLGPYYNPNTKSIALQNAKTNGTKEYYWCNDSDCNADSIDIHHEVARFGDRYDTHSLGFIYALFYPPYGFANEMDASQKYDLYKKIIEYYFDNFKSVKIFTWKPDDSEYFEAGKEWWGCYFYTVYNIIQEKYICILASTTD